MNLGDQRLSRLISRVRFSGEDELDRHVFSIEQGSESLEIAENERCAFVGREPASKPECQGTSIEQVIRLVHACRARFLTFKLSENSATQKSDASGF